MISDPKAWRAVSSLLLVVFIVALLLGDSSVRGWGWIALIASGVTFGVELVLIARSRRSG